jgi:Outer membrane protein/protective antigen OMA87
MIQLIRIILITVLFLMGTRPVFAAMSDFTDPSDGYLDMTNWLLEHKGFLPVPIIITEPAIGYGAGAALVFMQQHDQTMRLPPTITAIAAMGTVNGSMAGGVFHRRSIDQDQWRYLGGLGAASMNLDFYGLGGFATTSSDFSLGYNLKGLGTIQDIRKRLGDTKWYVGLRYVYMHTTVSFDSDYPSFFDGKEVESNNGGLAIVTNFDYRDNTLSPEDGYQAEFRYFFYDKVFGSDRKYQLAVLDMTAYWKFTEEWGSAARIMIKDISGDPPFYSVPYVDLRGVAKMRYQGDTAISTEAELRWRPQVRWEYSLFAGAGKAKTNDGAFENDDTAVSGGAGFRYLIAKPLGMRMGVDFAWGPPDSEFVFYIQAGTAWN